MLMTVMTVANLAESLETSRERLLQTTLGNLEVDENYHLKFKDTEETFPLDEAGEKSLSSYIGVSANYLNKCPQDLKTVNLNYWLNKKEEVDVSFEIIGTHINSVHSPSTLIIPIHPVVEMVNRVFQPTDEIVTLRRDKNLFHLDVQTSHHVEVPNPNRLEGRPEVGDITHGGVRFVSYHNPQDLRPPTATRYLRRLWCGNGSCEDYGVNSISLRGRTVPEVIEELEQAAHRILASLDESLQEYAALDGRPLPADRTALAHQIGQEHHLGTRVMSTVLDRVALLPEQATYYDLQNVFTAVANEPVSYYSATRLQQVGGSLAFNTEEMTHRCGACERLL